MTRFLSESLQAPEPLFRHGLRNLERANANPSTDIRLSAEIQQATREQVRALGLDASDTTPRELYRALQEKMRADDARLVRTLQTRAATYISAEGNVSAGMVHALQSLPEMGCFALKAGCLKKLLKLQPPKKAMKQLGFRSLDSLLKHESAASVVAAAYLSENPAWIRNLHEQYKRLKPSDFEVRTITVLHPTTARWHKLASQAVVASSHNLLSLPELGTIVLLPLPAAIPVGAVSTSLMMALQAVTDIRSTGTFLKLCQVRPDFGHVVQTIAATEPQLHAQLLDQPVSWQLIQRYCARGAEFLRDELFEPHLSQADLTWQGVEEAICSIEPSFEFWRNSTHLGILDDHEPVSLNMIDAALNFCNRLPFEQRIAHYFQKSLWHELLLRYLQPKAVAQTILSELQPALATDAVRVD